MMEKYDVFISYSRKDTAVADKICAAFDRAGITYFIDRQGIGGGMEFPIILARAIMNSKLFLFLASVNSYESKFTNSEITFAFNEKSKNCLLPYIIDKSNLPLEMRFIFSGINWRNTEDHPIDTILIEDVCRLLGKERKQSDIDLGCENKWKSSEGLNMNNMVGIPHTSTSSTKASIRQTSSRKGGGLPSIVYLGRVNKNNIFVKATKSFQMDSSVYRMDTSDGFNGIFSVINNAEIINRVYEDLEKWLGGGCVIDNPEDADIASEIVTLQPGESIYVDNVIHVIKKAHIRFY